jgi:DNA-binding NarL/FixJ family response regulator
MMKQDTLSVSRPLLKTKGFSTLHLQIFEYILIGKTNREINRILGYTERSHAVVDHSRKVMHKLLAMEDLHRADFTERVIYPRKFQFWWKKILDKHKTELQLMAIAPKFYK